MAKYKIIILFLGFGLMLKAPAFAQDIDIGMFGGGSYYLGELNPGRQFFFTQPAVGGILRWNFDTRWALRVNGLRGKIAGDDAVSKVNEMRNLRFTSSLTEMSAVAEFNFFPYFTGSNLTYFTPYLFAGPGFFIFKPKTDYNGAKVLLRNIHTEGQDEGQEYSTYGFAFVFGLGLKYSINSRLGLGLEWGMRKTFTDYLDDISKNYYIDFDKLAADEIGAAQILSDPAAIKHKPGMQRGNPQNNDWYSFAGITLTYRFTIGDKSTCSDFENSRK